jgi:SAM-dependent methyltransferase
MFSYILFPGRHHAITQFQIEYLRKLAYRDVTAETIDGESIQFTRHPKVIWAITSANHSNTRRNPISGYRRLAIVEGASLDLPIEAEAYLIPNMNPKKNFSHYLIEEIHVQSRGRVTLTPANCLVVCSTPQVIKQYQELGYTIAPAELSDIQSGAALARRPWDIVEEVIRSGAEWRSNSIVKTELHPACLDHYQRYCLGDLIVEIHTDPLLSHDDGDITDTRDYDTYRAAFEDNAFRKVEQFAQHIQPGRIMDIGCATGQTIKLLTQQPNLFESDFYGVEAARPLYDICEQRKSNGDFGLANVFFHQRNIMRSAIFPDNSLNTTITMALTHEIESYLGRPSLLEFLRRIYDMTAPGGIYINSDVAAPSRKDETVYVQFTSTDGENPADLFPELLPSELPEFLRSLSSKSRFYRFAQDFRREEGEHISYTTKTSNNVEYVMLKYGDLCEFLAKKDYTDSWLSEMHERFCFWNYSEWKNELTNVGFEVLEDSEPIENSWLIENRFTPAAQVFTLDPLGSLVPMPPPETNVLLIARKPE